MDRQRSALVLVSRRSVAAVKAATIKPSQRSATATITTNGVVALHGQQCRASCIANPVGRGMRTGCPRSLYGNIPLSSSSRSMANVWPLPRSMTTGTGLVSVPVMNPLNAMVVYAFVASLIEAVLPFAARAVAL